MLENTITHPVEIVTKEEMNYTQGSCDDPKRSVSYIYTHTYLGT
jgi:hypothetical protein